MAENHDEKEDEGKVNIEEIDAETASPEQVEALKKHAQSLQAQKSHWREKAIDPETGKPFKDLFKEATAKKDEKPLINDAPKIDETLVKDVAELKLEREKHQFGFANGLSLEETDNAFALAQGKGIKPSDAIKDPFFLNGMKALRDQKAAEAATPGVSSRSVVVDNKPFSQLSKDKRKEAFGKVVKPL